MARLYIVLNGLISILRLIHLKFITAVILRYPTTVASHFPLTGLNYAVLPTLRLFPVLHSVQFVTCHHYKHPSSYTIPNIFLIWTVQQLTILCIVYKET